MNRIYFRTIVTFPEREVIMEFSKHGDKIEVRIGGQLADIIQLSDECPPITELFQVSALWSQNYGEVKDLMGY